MDELETSSVFEGSECGEPADVETISLSSVPKKILPKREDILHRESGKDLSDSRYSMNNYLNEYSLILSRFTESS